MSADDVKKNLTRAASAAGGGGGATLDESTAAADSAKRFANDPDGSKAAAARKADAQKALDQQNAQDAANQASADVKTNAARLELLSRQGFGSTVLTGPGLLGRQSMLGA